MAKKLSAQKKGAYNCPPKRCPHPADFRGFPELQAYVNAEYKYRMAYCRNWKKTFPE
jgi:hypothetical protein